MQKKKQSSEKTLIPNTICPGAGGLGAGRGMFVSLRAVNFGFWSVLDKTLYLGLKVSFRVEQEEIEIEIFNPLRTQK